MDNVFRHSRIDLAGKFDKARVFAILTRLPRKVKWIDWDTVTARSRPEVERHKTEWLGFVQTIKKLLGPAAGIQEARKDSGRQKQGARD
jgi:hypothetical protein